MSNYSVWSIEALGARITEWRGRLQHAHDKGQLLSIWGEIKTMEAELNRAVIEGRTEAAVGAPSQEEVQRPPKTNPFPMTDQQVHEALLTDPKVHMLATVFVRVREACVDVSDEQLAALAVYVLATAGRQPNYGPMVAVAIKQAPSDEDIKKLLERLEL